MSLVCEFLECIAKGSITFFMNVMVPFERVSLHLIGNTAVKDFCTSKDGMV